MKDDALKVYKKVIEFLNIEYDDRTVFEAENTSKTYKSKAFQQVILALSAIRRKLGIYRGTGIRKWNDKKEMRKPLSETIYLELQEYFKPEILKLENILKRDLSYWEKSK